MRKYILLLSLIFLSFAFKSDGIVGWYEVPNNINDQINDICFLDTLNGYIATLGDNSPVDTGYVMKTTNGGANWTIVLRNAGNMDRVKFFDVNTGYAFGNVGFVKFFKTTNGGNNWQDLSAGVPLYFSADMYFINRDTGWVCSASSLNGGIAKTTNGGMNWQLQLGPNPHPKQVFFANTNTGWAITNFDVYKTTNGGFNWIVQNSFVQSVRKLFAITPDTLYMIGTAPGGHLNSIRKSTNGGTNWFNQIVYDPDNTSCLDIFMLNSKKGWISCGNSRILKVTDGELWKIQSAPEGNYYSIQFLDSSKGFSGGTKFIATKDGGGPVTAVNNILSEVPSDFKLYQNYPNPFNPITSFKFEVSSSNYVSIKVYDLKGKEIAILVNNEKKNAGEYTINFDAGKYNLSSGIYFYTLQVNDFTHTKKMILLK